VRKPSCYGTAVSLHAGSPCLSCCLVSPCATKLSRDPDAFGLLVQPRLVPADQVEVVDIPKLDAVDPALDSETSREFRRIGLHRLGPAGWWRWSRQPVARFLELRKLRAVLEVALLPPARVALFPVCRRGMDLRPIYDRDDVPARPTAGAARTKRRRKRRHPVGTRVVAFDWRLAAELVRVVTLVCHRAVDQE